MNTLHSIIKQYSERATGRLTEISTVIKLHNKHSQGKHLKATSVSLSGMHTQTHTHTHAHTRPHQSRQLIRALAAWLYSVYLIRRIHMLPLCWPNNGEKTPFTDEPQYPRISLLKQIFLIFFFFCGKVGLSRAG